ncbi:MAG TPA: deoxyribodipyrimidine photo-lyase [Nitrosomonas mobilis]|nr:deoxyribodipyrimidine photo-lyase [Nitrosomonas mobilis]
MPATRLHSQLLSRNEYPQVVEQPPPLSIFWFRRDLRLQDNTALTKALAAGKPVLPVFIFDSHILTSLPRNDARVTFIFDTLQTLNAQLAEKFASGVAFFYGKPLAIFEQLLHTYRIDAVYANRDYEPYARERDATVHQLLQAHGIRFFTYKDHVLFETDEIVKPDNQPYVVYTPYQKRWKTRWQEMASHSEQIEPNWENLAKDWSLPSQSLPQLTMAQIGFERSTLTVADYRIDAQFLQTYGENRDFPARTHASRLGPYLRFGTVSIRQIMRQSIQAEAEIFINELIWREFFSQILWHFPHTVSRSFKLRYDQIKWRNNENEFTRWCAGMTGYPLVDAGMRQLNATGHLHNRVRMVAGSFLCKHLLIDWRWGEAYFAQKLLDFELASNVGNWQWVAGCGVDAAPYFRIFNPSTQIERFDPDWRYIEQWVEEVHQLAYPQPIVEHNFARQRCLEVYKRALGAS